MSRRSASYPSVKYAELNKRHLDFIDSQFQSPAKVVPWKSISFAALLFISGIIMLTAGCLIGIGYLDAMYEDRMWPLLTMGFLTFVPGAYHIRIAYHAYNRSPGYSFEDIPEFE